MAHERGLILDGGLPPSNSFVVPDKKIVYISVTKAACSSLRWMIADLAGEDPERFYRVTAPHPTRLMTIHSQRQRWQRTPRLSDLPDAQLNEIYPDNGWFVFAVVRDPWSRLWSAWQSKFLVRHISYVRTFGTQPWFPRIPEKAEHVVEDFRAFVEAHPWTDDPQLKRDSHFYPQARSVRSRGLDYTRVYDLSGMSELQTDLKAHLAGLGQDTNLYLPRANETPLHLTEAVLADGVADRITGLYNEDFDAFPGRWDLSGVRFGPQWTADALRMVAVQTNIYERLGDVSDQANHIREQLRETRSELRAARKALAVAERPVGLRDLPRVAAGAARRRVAAFHAR